MAFWNESVLTKVVVAPLHKRMLAYLVDVGFAMLMMLWVGLVEVVVVGVVDQFVWGTLFNEWVIFGMVLVAFISAFVYLFLRDGFNGHGLGKFVCGLQVVRHDTLQPIGYGRSALRYLCIRISLFIELLVLLIQPNHRRIGDWLANSVVIERS